MYVDFTAPKATVGNMDDKIEVKSPSPFLNFNYLSLGNESQKRVAVGIDEMGRTIMNVTPHVSEWRFSNKTQDLFALIKDGTLMLASNT